jgi:hypothetical protein
MAHESAIAAARIGIREKQLTVALRRVNSRPVTARAGHPIALLVWLTHLGFPWRPLE